MVDRTARLATVRERGIDYIRGLYHDNMRDLLVILRWNVEHGIVFYRVSSGIAPHITNDALLEMSSSTTWYKSLAYRLDCSAARAVRDYVAEHKLRLTFHAEPYVVLSTADPTVRMRSQRDIYYHYKLMKVLGLGPESCVIVHGGGVYDDKLAAMERWRKCYLELPVAVRSRIVLENDERRFSIEDVLEISEAIAEQQSHRGGTPNGGAYENIENNDKSRSGLAIVFDIFHYECCNRVRVEAGLPPLPAPETYLPRIIASWHRAHGTDLGPARVKMHISNQRPDAPLGAHADYVESIPAWMRRMTGLDLMVEAKQDELAVLALRKKYRMDKLLPTSKIGGGPTVFVLGDKAWARRVAAACGGVAVRDPERIADADVVVARGQHCAAALAYQAGHYMVRGLVLVEPVTHGVVLDNVIVHGTIPMGAERYYPHYNPDTDAESIGESVEKLTA